VAAQRSPAAAILYGARATEQAATEGGEANRRTTMASEAGGGGKCLARICLALWSVLVLLGSLLPQPPGAASVMAFRGADFAAHVAAYGVLCALAHWSLGGAVRGSRLGRAASGAAGFGLLLECVQPMTGRRFEGEDLLATLLGVALAVVVLLAVTRLRPGAAGARAG
jgi:hypothetical protein